MEARALTLELARELSWAAAFCAWLDRGKDRGVGCGPPGQNQRGGFFPFFHFLFLFSFKTKLFQNIFTSLFFIFCFYFLLKQNYFKIFSKPKFEFIFSLYPNHSPQ